MAWNGVPDDDDPGPGLGPSSGPSPGLTGPTAPGNLPGELAKWKALVRELQEKCQDLLQQIEVATASRSDFGLESRQHGSDIQGYISEIIELKKQIEELVDKNFYWQKFHEEREQLFQEKDETIRRLTLMVAQLEQKLQLQQQQLQQGHQQQQLQQRHQQPAREESPVSERCERLADSRVVELENLLVQQKGKLVTLEDNNIKLLDEIRKLKRQLNEQRPAEASPGLLAERERLKEQVQILQVQLTVNREDFEMERRDREIAQQKVYELEQLLLSYKDNQRQTAPLSIFHQAQQLAPLPPHTSASHSSPLPSHRAIFRSDSRQLVSPGLYFTDSEETETDGDSVVAGVKSAAVPREVSLSTSLESIQSERKTESPVDYDSKLRCPKCLQQFSSDDHMKLIEHIEECM